MLVQVNATDVKYGAELPLSNVPLGFDTFSCVINKLNIARRFQSINF